LKKQGRERKRRGRERLEREDALYVEYLGIWPVTAGIEEKRKGNR